MCKSLNKIRLSIIVMIISAVAALTCTKLALNNKRGENFIDSGFKVLIVVVIASLLLAGLYALFGDVIMPTLTEKVTELFNYNG